MQHPAEEIKHVIEGLIRSPSPSLQASAIEQYMTEDVGFRHPACRIDPGLNSRQQLLGVYRWLRTLASDIEFETKCVSWDKERNTLFVDYIQKPQMRFSPFVTSPGSYLIRLTLRQKENGLYYICFQEDFMHPDQAAAQILAPLAPIVRGALRMSACACSLGVNAFSMLGVWKDCERKDSDKLVN